MRNYYHFDEYLDELSQDVYDQPDDVGHTRMAEDIIRKWIADLSDVHHVLDVGCGTGFCSEFFHQYGLQYTGIELNYEQVSPIILKMDFTFTELSDDFCDLVFSRHSLEHSPFPLITLMEWHRVSSKYLLLVVPNPDHYTYVGRNHYSVMNSSQCRWMLRRAGWKTLFTDYSEPTELRFFCGKMERVGYEGYLETLTGDILEADQQGL